MPPRAVDNVPMSSSTYTKETDGVIDGLVCVAVRFDVPVRRPAVTAHRTASN
jgi:hypothetical protein